MQDFLDTRVTRDERLVYNLSKTIHIETDNMSVEYYTTYTVVEGDSWTIIAYDKLGDWKLWWLLCKFNQVLSPIELPIPGTVLNIPTPEITSIILGELQ